MPHKLPFSSKRLPNRVILSYIFDYLIIFILAGTFYSLDAIEPFHQHFALQNYTLQYPYAVHERVPIPLLLTCCALIPIIIIAVYTLFIDGLYSHQTPAQAGHQPRKSTAAGRTFSGRYRWKDRLWELNCGVLGLLLAQGAAFVITGALKNAAGKPRPDLIDRCQPKTGSVDPPVYGLSNSSICTQTDNSILKDGFRSFPSGHSSSAWAGLFYLTLYLAAKLHVLDNRGEVWKTFIVLIPSLGAALIAISRIMDARHHPFDVISGSLLGILVAWASYRQYFPPVGDTRRKGRAYPIRTWGTKRIDGPPVRERRGYDVDSGVEPFRRVDDEETTSMAAVPPSPLPSAAMPPTSPTGNYFRDQIHRNDTHRGGATQLGSSNPYVQPQGGNSLAPRHVNLDDSSTTSSVASDSDEQQQYEMQTPRSRFPYAAPNTEYQSQTTGQGRSLTESQPQQPPVPPPHREDTF